jgi:hypothetical protein
MWSYGVTTWNQIVAGITSKCALVFSDGYKRVLPSMCTMRQDNLPLSTPPAVPVGGDTSQSII